MLCRLWLLPCWASELYNVEQWCTACILGGSCLHVLWLPPAFWVALAHMFCGCLQKKNEAAEYHKILTTRLREQRERRSESLAKKRALRMASQASRDEAKTGRTPAS